MKSLRLACSAKRSSLFHNKKAPCKLQGAHFLFELRLRVQQLELFEDCTSCLVILHGILVNDSGTAVDELRN